MDKTTFVESAITILNFDYYKSCLQYYCIYIFFFFDNNKIYFNNIN